MISEPCSRNKTIEFLKEAEKMEEQASSEPKTQSEKTQKHVVHIGEMSINKLAHMSQSQRDLHLADEMISSSQTEKMSHFCDE